MAKAVTPRLQRRDEKLNEQLVPLFDPTGRLFLASEDPVPVNRELTVKEQIAEPEIRRGDDQRGARRAGLPPVPWGDAPWLPRQWARTDMTATKRDAANTGRQSSPENERPSKTDRNSKCELRRMTGTIAFAVSCLPGGVIDHVRLPHEVALWP